MNCQYCGKIFRRDCMGTHASHNDDDEDTEDESSSGNSSDESKAKEDAFAQILPAFRKELGDVHMDNLTWMTVIWKFSKASGKLL